MLMSMPPPFLFSLEERGHPPLSPSLKGRERKFSFTSGVFNFPSWTKQMKQIQICRYRISRSMITSIHRPPGRVSIRSGTANVGLADFASRSTLVVARRRSIVVSHAAHNTNSSEISEKIEKGATASTELPTQGDAAVAGIDAIDYINRQLQDILKGPPSTEDYLAVRHVLCLAISLITPVAVLSSLFFSSLFFSLLSRSQALAAAL